MIYAGPYIEVEYEGDNPPVPADINEERQDDFTQVNEERWSGSKTKKNTVAWVLNYTDSVGQELDCYSDSVTNITPDRIAQEIEAFSNDSRVVFWLNMLFTSNIKATVKWGIVVNRLFDQS